MSVNRILAAAALAMTGLLFTPAAANAAAPWSTDYYSDNYLWISSNGLDFYNTTDEVDTFASQFYKSGLLRLSDGAASEESSGGWCTDPITPGTVQFVGADTIITCAPHTIGVGQSGAGLTGTVEIRILHDIDVMRLFFTVENSTGSDITVPVVYSNVQWEDTADNGVSSSGASGDGTSEFTLGSEDTWVITTDDSGNMPSAVVWAAAGDTTFTVSGDSGDIDIRVAEATTFEAGASRYYANFLQMETPTAQTDTAMNAAIADLADSLATRYTALTAELSVGMPAGIDVEGWTSSSPDSEPLAKTGSDGAVLAGSAVLAALLATLAVVARKTRRQRS